MDGLDGSLGLVKYRAPYGAHNNSIAVEDPLYISNWNTDRSNHNNNENKRLQNETLNISSNDHFGFYQTNSKTNNANSCFQLQSMSKELSNLHSSSNPYHVPKVKFQS